MRWLAVTSPTMLSYLSFDEATSVETVYYRDVMGEGWTSSAKIEDPKEFLESLEHLLEKGYYIELRRAPDLSAWEKTP